MQLKSRRKAARGFTLIELVIVIAVIAILAALLVPTILGQAERARVSRAKSDATEIAKALARIRTDTAFVDAATPLCYIPANVNAAPSGTPAVGPAACGGLPACTPATVGELCWGGPYMSAAVADDPWGQAWTTTYNVDTNAITVTSNGPDKTASTADDIVVTQ